MMRCGLVLFPAIASGFVHGRCRHSGACFHRIIRMPPCLVLISDTDSV